MRPDEFQAIRGQDPATRGRGNRGWWNQTEVAFFSARAVNFVSDRAKLGFGQRRNFVIQRVFNFVPFFRYKGFGLAEFKFNRIQPVGVHKAEYD